MKFFEKEVGKLEAADKMKRGCDVTVRFDSHETVSIEIGSSCTLRLSEKEVDALRRLLFDASNGVAAARNQKAELAATMAAVGFVEIK
tara:strand:- start:273 stop:536 length:264 start_codon:yes stop_codon:yes gene_type:complete